MTRAAVFGCGIDVEELARFDRYVGAGNDSLVRGICSEREFAALRRGDARARFALSFCCKEAFFKALGASWTNSEVSWRDIELLFCGPGLRECEVRLYGRARDIVTANRLRVGEAVCGCNDVYALFQVVLVAEDAEAGPGADGGSCGREGDDEPLCWPRCRAIRAGREGST